MKLNWSYKKLHKNIKTPMKVRKVLENYFKKAKILSRNNPGNFNLLSKLSE